MITIVVAMGLKNEIGADNQLLWHLPKDLKHFKEITSGHPIIMGRKTYESIGKPLPNRTNIVVSRKKDWFEEGILIVGSIKEALKFAKKMDENIYIIGGGNIYEQTIDLADRLEVTQVKAELEGLSARKAALQAELRKIQREEKEYDTLRQNVDALLERPKEQEQQRQRSNDLE